MCVCAYAAHSFRSPGVVVFVLFVSVVHFCCLFLLSVFVVCFCCLGFRVVGFRVEMVSVNVGGWPLIALIWIGFATLFSV